MEVVVAAGTAIVEAFEIGARTTAEELLGTWPYHSLTVRVDEMRLMVVVVGEHYSCGQSGDVVAGFVHSGATDLDLDQHHR